VEVSNGSKAILGTHNSNLSEFKGLGIKIDYPVDWKMEQEAVSSQSGSVIFRAPFEDEGLETPSWHETSYTMAIAIDSVQHAAVTDYRVILNRSQTINNNSTPSPWTWTRQVFEVSAHGKMRLFEQEKNYTGFHEKDRPYVLFYFNLDKVNFPQQYKAVFYITDYFTKEHRFCRLIDITNWIIIPPPVFSMSTKPNSTIVLRPGQETDLELVLKGNTHLPSEALLTQANNNNSNNDNSKYLNLTFVPSRVSILPFSAGVSVLHIKALDNAKAHSYTLPIVSNITFPNTITNRGGETFSNSKRESLTQTSNLTLTVLPPYTMNERVNDFVKNWITPITGLWTFLAAVGAVVVPLVIRGYRKKRKYEDNKRNQKEKEEVD